PELRIVVFEPAQEIFRSCTAFAGRALIKNRKMHQLGETLAIPHVVRTVVALVHLAKVADKPSLLPRRRGVRQGEERRFFLWIPQR
ncbi:MAG: hypothetical protein WCC90_20140, partial [Methylocella sp.]